MDLNKAQIIGRLTRDPELRTTPTGISVCTISVATGFAYTSQQTGQKVEQTEFHNIVLWRKLGEIASQYLKKGRKVFIEGRLQTRSWDAQDGSKKYRTEIIADNMIMLDGGPNSGTNSASAPAASAAPTGAPRTNYATNAQESAGMNQPPVEEELPTIQENDDVAVDDIPF